MENQGEGFAGNDQLSEELEQVFQEEPIYVKTMMMTMMTNLRPKRMKRGMISVMTPCVSSTELTEMRTHLHHLVRQLYPKRNGSLN